MFYHESDLNEECLVYSERRPLAWVLKCSENEVLPYFYKIIPRFINYAKLRATSLIILCVSVN